MNPFLQELTDTELFEQLANKPGKTSLIREVQRRIGGTIERAVADLPDPEAAYWEASYELTRPETVRHYLGEWTGSLAGLARTVAQSREATQAGGIGRAGRSAREDAMLIAGSLDAALDARPDLEPIAAVEPLSEAQKAERIREIREAFIELTTPPTQPGPRVAKAREVRVPGFLTAQEREAVLRYANIHSDSALPEMGIHAEIAKTMRVSVSTVQRLIRSARAEVASRPVLSIALWELGGDFGVEASVQAVAA